MSSSLNKDIIIIMVKVNQYKVSAESVCLQWIDKEKLKIFFMFYAPFYSLNI